MRYNRFIESSQVDIQNPELIDVFRDLFDEFGILPHNTNKEGLLWEIHQAREGVEISITVSNGYMDLDDYMDLLETIHRYTKSNILPRIDIMGYSAECAIEYWQFYIFLYLRDVVHESHIESQINPINRSEVDKDILDIFQDFEDEFLIPSDSVRFNRNYGKTNIIIESNNRIFKMSGFINKYIITRLSNVGYKDSYCHSNLENTIEIVIPNEKI